MKHKHTHKHVAVQVTVRAGAALRERLQAYARETAPTFKATLEYTSVSLARSPGGPLAGPVKPTQLRRTHKTAAA